MPRLLEPRFEFKLSNGFEYPRYFEAFKKSRNSIWNEEEVGMGDDVADWKNSEESVRKIIGGILRGFTQTEVVIDDYWASIRSKIPKPEVHMMCNAFSFFESIHQVAYNHLSSTLNIDEYKEYKGDPLAQQKVEYLLNDNSQSLKVKLAVFSGGAEGVALFSSFSILLSYAKDGLFKGVSQIISWSIADEQSHSDMGIELFLDLVEDEGITKAEIDAIKLGFDTIMANEFAFLDNVFGNQSSINGVPKLAFYEFIKHRANDRLTKMKLPKELHYPYDEKLSQIVAEWFYPMANGSSSNDFFSHLKDGSQYVSKYTYDITKINLNELDL